MKFFSYKSIIQAKQQGISPDKLKCVQTDILKDDSKELDGVLFDVIM